MKRKLNWIDYCVIIIIIGIGAVLGLKAKNVKILGKANLGNVENTKKKVVIVAEDVREYSTKAINIGDKLYSDKTSHYFGDIVDIEIEESYIPLVKDNGEVVYARSPERYNMILTVDCNILEKPDGYFAEGITEVKVNSAAKYKTIGAIFKGITYSIEE